VPPRRAAEIPPLQARSRETLRRLLDAAEAVMLAHGPEGATLPRIARQARVSPATVYRRFRDKEALMRAVFRRFNERSSGAVRDQFDREAVRALGLVRFSTNVVQGMVQGFRANAALSRAAIQYAERHPRADFVRQSGVSEAKSLQTMVDTFLMWRDEIDDPDPERAIRFAFLIVAAVLRDLVLFDRMRLMARVTPVDDGILKRELPKVFLRCLGVRVQPDAQTKKGRRARARRPSRIRHS
jgi:AcrR family transcriptional regulator